VAGVSESLPYWWASDDGRPPVAIHTSIRKEKTMTEYKSDLLFGACTGNGRILVVDDEPAIRAVIRKMLEKGGYDVVEADDGEAAIEAINSGENRLMVDAVICDIRMPKINGLDAIAYFRRTYPRVPLIVLTGYPDTEMAITCMRDGVVDYLVKPVEGKRLKVAVEKAMEQRELAWR
jgi:two-component system chemotaxis response regulator CheY